VESSLVQPEKIEVSKVLEDRILQTLRQEKPKKVGELVNSIRKSENSLSVEEILEVVETLEDDKKITLIEPPVTESFHNHLIKNFSSYLHFWLGIATVMFYMSTTYLLPAFEPSYMIRIVTGAPIVLLMPGYGLVDLLLSKRDIALIERLGIAFLLSLAMVLLIWLALNNSMLGASANTVVACISALGIILILASTHRQFKQEKKFPVRS
jgi:hypothetical protein